MAQERLQAGEVQARLFAAGNPSERPEEIRQAILRVVPEPEHDVPDFLMPESEQGSKVNAIREIQEKDLFRVLQWFSDPETQGHLDPLPKLPKEWSDENEVLASIVDLAKYYDNQGEPEKITALAAVNAKDKALGVATIRWRGDPWVPQGHKIASIERVLVNSKIRGKGIGNQLMDAAELKAFDERGFKEVRVWVMTDDQAGPDKGGRNLYFFRERGYEIIRGTNYSWRKYAELRGLGENAENREALWLSLKSEDWAAREKGRQIKNPSTSGK